MNIESNIALISINETLFIQLICFLIFIVIMNKIMFRPLNKVIDDRTSYLAEMNKVIDTSQKLADITADLQKQEFQVKTEAFCLQNDLLEDGSQTANQINKDAMSKIREIRKKAELEAEAKMTEARKSIKQDSEALAINVMEKVLNRRLAS